MYEIHPSPTLRALFVKKPYQGVPPEEATFLFVGLDANYSPTIEREPIFSKICEYHEDGAAFWKKYNVHHPFLLPQYKGDGRYYHKSFAQIGFTAEQADYVSFAELLHVPTVGRNQLDSSDLSTSHLSALSHTIVNGKARHVFLPAGVLRLMRATRKFNWLPTKHPDSESTLRVVYRDSYRTVYEHLHFSVYGKFQARKEEEAAAIHALLKRN